MDFSEAIRARALRNVVSEKDIDGYRLRYIFRWYSKTFHTPLLEVDELPLEDVLLAFYECQFEEMTNEKLQDALDEVLESPEEKQERLKEKDTDDADADMMLAEAKRIAEEKRKAKPHKILPKDKTIIPNLPKDLPPDIKFEFVDRNLLEGELNGFGAMTQPED